MMFATPLGLLALLAIPAIVAIHLFRRRFPRQDVAGLFLWQLVRQAPEGGGRITRLPLTSSLLLECLAALALALILAGARLSPAAPHHHLVVLLDDSASMGAVDAAGESSRDRAVRRVLRELEQLGTTARITIVRSGDRPSVLVGPAALRIEGEAALREWRPEATDHSLALGVRLARELAGQTGRLMVVSDLPPEARGERSFDRGLWVATGRSGPNAGIISAQRTLSPDDGRGAVSLTIVNHSESTVRRRLTVTARADAVLTRELDLPTGVASVVLPLPPGLPPVSVALSDDALARDNRVVLVEPRPRIVGFSERLPDGGGREALLKAVGALSGVTRAESAHILFVEAAELDRPNAAGTWRVGFGRPPRTWRAAGDPVDYIGPFVVEKRHPLLTGATLDGVVWAGVMPLGPAAARPLVSAGDRTLIGTTGGGSDPAIVFNVDLDRTNLVRAPDWPILISNVVEMRRETLPGPERWNYRVGEWIRVRLPREPRGTLRIRSERFERTVQAGRSIEFVAPSPGGLLQIVEGGEGLEDEAVLYELGVNFLDETEGDLRRQTTADTGELSNAAALRAESGPASDPLFWVLLAVGAAAIVANWCLLPAWAGRA